LNGFRLESLLDVEEHNPACIKTQADCAIEIGIGEFTKIGVDRCELLRRHDLISDLLQ
jgi:hypothetical protein